MSFLFTSESVTEGHPDKICDQISDAILDAYLTKDPYSRVACEALTKNNMIIVAGEVSSKATINVTKVVRETLKKIGYDNYEAGLDYKTCSVLVALEEQSPDIAQGVLKNNDDNKVYNNELGAGDQGLMFGFATNETPELMPLPIMLAHSLTRALSKARKEKIIPYLLPDGKSQVTVEYDDDYNPLRVHTIVLSAHHKKDIKESELKELLIKKIIEPTLKDYIDEKTIIHINPTGSFIIGGPQADAGLTGRKIIVDTYGGFGRHGGGAFSGKDPTKVDRSGAYAARFIAKNIVAAGLAKRCEVQLAYAIGIAEPVSIKIDTFNEKIDSERLLLAVKKLFPLKPKEIIDYFSLRRPIYLKTASYGHFGNPDFPWESTEKALLLRKEMGLE